MKASEIGLLLLCIIIALGSAVCSGVNCLGV